MSLSLTRPGNPTLIIPHRCVPHATLQASRLHHTAPHPRTCAPSATSLPPASRPSWPPCSGSCGAASPLTTYLCAFIPPLLCDPAGITPAAHRAASSHARPLSPIVAPCLAPALAALLGQLRGSFPPVEACLAADKEGCSGQRQSNAGAGGSSAAAALGPVQQLTGASGSGVLSLVQRPRLLVCGAEGSGQSHLAPGLLHALEGLPIHSVSLPSLLADAGARWVRCEVVAGTCWENGEGSTCRGKEQPEHNGRWYFRAAPFTNTHGLLARTAFPELLPARTPTVFLARHCPFQFSRASPLTPLHPYFCPSAK